jgi:hypothetical protein
MNSKSWIIPSDPSGALRGIELGHLVKDLGIVFQSLKSVGKLFGYVNHAKVRGCEVSPNPPGKGRRARSKVDDDVVNRSFGAAN